MKNILTATLALVFTLIFNGGASGQISYSTNSFADSLAGGINPAFWMLRTNTSIFSIATNGGDVYFSKASGGVTNFQYATLASLLVARGDFSVQITFTNASINIVSAAIGNQIQLNTRFGGEDFLMVRSDEQSPGNNVHVFARPPGNQLFGTTGSTASSGTFRVTRTNTLVQGYFNSILLYQNNYNTNDATFSLVLQNNQSTDAIACGFENFQLTASSLLFLPPQLAAQALPPNNVVVSWNDTSWPDALAGYFVQSTTNLSGVIAWQTSTNIPLTASNRYYWTNPATAPATFFRVKQGP